VIDDEPPEIDPGKIVFETEGPNRFHALLHPWYSRECDDRWLHLQRAWEYRWKEELRAATLCRIGRHRVVKSYRRDRDELNRGVGPWRIEFRCYACGHRPPLPS
jgi:hypothetical protein